MATGFAGAAPVARRPWPRARPVRLAYQPPANSTFLSQQTSQQYSSLRTNQQPASSTLLSEQTSTSHWPTEQAVDGATSSSRAHRLAVGGHGGGFTVLVPQLVAPQLCFVPLYFACTWVGAQWLDRDSSKSS
jgi:hypothetical protein